MTLSTLYSYRLSLEKCGDTQADDGDFPGDFGGISQELCPSCGAPMLSLYSCLEDAFGLATPIVIPYCFACKFCFEVASFRISSNVFGKISQLNWIDFLSGHDQAMQREWEEISVGYPREAKKAHATRVDTRSEALLAKRSQFVALDDDEQIILASYFGRFSDPELGSYPIIEPFTKFLGTPVPLQPIDLPLLRCSCGIQMHHLMTIANHTMDLHVLRPLVLPCSVVLAYKCPVHAEIKIFNQM